MLNLIYLFTTGSLFLLAFLLISQLNKVNQKANFWFALFVFLVACVFLDDCFMILNMLEQYPHLQEFTNLPLFLLAPTLFLSVIYFTNPQKKFIKIDYLHFLPFVLLLVYYLIVFLFITGIQESRETLQTHLYLISFVILTLLFTQIIAYTVLSLIKIYKHQSNIKFFASATGAIDLAWLQYFLYGIVFLVLLWLGELIFELSKYWAYLGYFTGVYYLAYFALNQKEIYPFSKEDTQDIIEVIEEIEATEEQKTPLFPNLDIENEKIRLNELMKNEKPYLDNELGLPKLAQLCQLSTHELSYLLNEGFEENFYEFVNRYRVEGSKKLLADTKFQHLNMVGIAFESGFNSKTAFNTAFKKLTGQTPSEFRKS
jgi:AraC-like DNA-binding protein